MRRELLFLAIGLVSAVSTGFDAQVPYGLIAAELPANCTLPGMVVRPGDPLGYRDRGDRCEGTYARRVDGSIRLKVLGLHAQIPVDRAVKPSESLLVRPVGGIARPPLTLKVRTKRYNSFYAMDTDRMSAAGFSWPAAIVTQIVPNVRLSELGALACTLECVAPGRTLVPVAFATPPTPPVFQIVLVSEANLKSVTYRVEGPRTETRRISRSLPANIPFILPLGSLSPGSWRVTIQAKTSSDKSTRTVESMLVS